MAIRNFQGTFGSFPLQEYFKLFDAMVKPILTYGAEIWGYEFSDIIEQVQTQFCKDFLGLNRSANDCMSLGECGRMPLCVDYHLKCIKYWCKLLHMPSHRYPRNCYVMLKRHDDIGRTNRATSVKQLLFKYGFGYAWIYQQVGNVDNFLYVFKQRLISCKLQNWVENVNDSTRCDTYRQFKSLLNPAKYLCINLPFCNRKAFARFRCSSHNFLIEKGRHQGLAREDRICTYCFEILNVRTIEDEFHVFFHCLKYQDERDTLLLSWYHGDKELYNFNNLMKSTNDLILRKITKYVFSIMYKN